MRDEWNIKRAIEVAIAGGHTLTIIGYKDGIEKMVKEKLSSVDIMWNYIYFCPCGEVQENCYCQEQEIEKYQKENIRFLDADIVIRVDGRVRITQEDIMNINIDCKKVSLKPQLLTYEARELFNRIVEYNNLSPIQIEKLISVASTISAMENYLDNGIAVIDMPHLFEAFAYIKPVKRR